jgi:hypothetical protein
MTVSTLARNAGGEPAAWKGIQRVLAAGSVAVIVVSGATVCGATWAYGQQAAESPPPAHSGTAAPPRSPASPAVPPSDGAVPQPGQPPAAAGAPSSPGERSETSPAPGAPAAAPPPANTRLRSAATPVTEASR